MDFVHLHVHTKYSVRDGIIRIEELAEKCKKDGMRACAITDHGAMYGVVDFYNTMKKAGIKPILGYESYTAPDSDHLILLAKNNQGYKNLIKLCSQENIEGLVKAGRFAKGNLDLDWVKSNNLGEGIIALTACIGGTACKQILNGKIDNAINYIIKLQNIFEEVYIELQDNSTKEQAICNYNLMNIAKQLNLKIVITKDAHYLNKEDWEAHDSMLAIQINKSIDDPKRWRFPGGPDYYIATKDEMITACDNFKIPYDAMTNTAEIANKCNVHLFDEKDANGNIIHNGVYSGSLFPDYPFVPEGYNQDTYLAKIAFGGLTDFIMTRPPGYKMNVKEYIDRLNYELDIISSMGYSGYFLILWDFLKYCREYRDAEHPSGIGLGTGRGCFTKDALVHTKETLKSIKDIQIGDEVISKDGLFHKVIDTMHYDIEEEMIQIKHLYGTDKYYPSICTKDHKILINRNNELQWIEAQNILKTDYVCVPKINTNDTVEKIIDLNDYNKFGYEYDDNYIYEYKPFSNNQYEYSPKSLSRTLNIGESVLKNFANGIKIRDKNNELKILSAIPFNTQEEYCNYIRDKRTIKLNRYIKVDETFNTFIGLMYGDGFNPCNRDVSIGLAINSETDKDAINKKIFYDIANRLNVPVYEDKSKTKKLIQLYINCKVFREFVSKELFVSKINKEKQFNNKWFNQNKDNLKALLKGLQLSDGSIDNNRINFDNTSKSIINAYKLLSLMTSFGINSISVRKSRIDNRGYNCKESYKLRVNTNAKNAIKISERIMEDEHYYYLPIKEIKLLPKQKVRVYDMTVEGQHNYLLNNMIVHNSGVGSLVCRSCNITKIDPIKYVLLFERFLNPERESEPDVDKHLMIA